jgi:hypothetical protein
MKKLLTLTLFLPLFAMAQSKPDTTTYTKDVSAEFNNGMYVTQKKAVWDTVDSYFGIETSNGKIKGEVNIVWYNGYAVRRYEKPVYYLDKHKSQFKNTKIIYVYSN